MPTTVRALVDEALLKHWSFAERRMPPGGMLLFLNRKAEELLLLYGRAVEPLVGEARQMAATVSGSLVGVTDAGTPYYITTSEDGWPVSATAGGTPYVDFTQPAIATDPFGSSSSNPGFPLPADFVKSIAMTANYRDGREGPITVLAEKARHEGGQGRDLYAYINGGRVIPVRPKPLMGSDGWSDVTSIAVSYIKHVQFTKMTDIVRLPGVLCGALVAALVDDLARSAKPEQVSAGDKAAFAQRAVDAVKLMLDCGDKLLDDLRADYVIIND